MKKIFFLPKDYLPKNYFEKHVIELSHEIGVFVHYKASGVEYASIEVESANYISIKPVKTQITYVVALHELGHFATMSFCGGSCSKELESEARAWIWARKNSKFGWSSVMEKVAKNSILTYVIQYSLEEVDKLKKSHPIFKIFVDKKDLIDSLMVKYEKS